MSEESHKTDLLDEKVAEVLKDLEDGLKLMGWKMASDELAFREAIMKHPRYMVGEVVMAATFCISTQEDGTLHPYVTLRAVKIDGVNIDLFGSPPSEHEDGSLYPEFVPYTAMARHGAVDLLQVDIKYVQREYAALDELWFLVAYERALARRRTPRLSGVSVPRSSFAPATMSLTPCVHFGTRAFLTSLLLLLQDLVDLCSYACFPECFVQFYFRVTRRVL